MKKNEKKNEKKKTKKKKKKKRGEYQDEKIQQKWVGKNKYLPFTLPKEWPIHSLSNNVIIPWKELSFSQIVFALCTGVMSNIDPMVQSR